MNSVARKLDNAAKLFSLDEKKNTNTFRLSVYLKDKVDAKILKSAVIKTLDKYPNFKVKMKSGMFWNYFKTNSNKIIVEEEIDSINKRIAFNNNDYLFKITYYKNKINLNIYHILTDGVGAIDFIKAIIYNYLDLKYDLVENNYKYVEDISYDYYEKYANKKLMYKSKNKKSYLIQDKAKLESNKTFHYVLDLNKLKKVSKNNSVSITEYLTALYIYTMYKTVYNKKSNKDIVVTVPIDLRSHYKVKTLTNFFTCTNIEGDVLNKKITFDRVLKQVHKEFETKITKDNVKKYLAMDVKLGTNAMINYIPLFIKKKFMKYFSGLVNNATTSTLSNIGKIELEDQYKKYVDNIVTSINAGKYQKIKCTVCSYENNITVTINSNLVDDKFEKEFSRLLNKHIGKLRVEV